MICQANILKTIKETMKMLKKDKCQMLRHGPCTPLKPYMVCFALALKRFFIKEYIIINLSKLR